MEQTASTALQLIDQHKNFSGETLTTVLAPLGHCGKEYFTVAIIGSQNTGKSTLLNHLFGTNFKVLEGLAGCRTTRGIVLGRDRSSPLVVLDVEGNDSYENHLQGDENYQKMVSSFALVASNLLIVNIHEKQLGQHTGSQYQTLSIVLRICIDQFKQESPKTVLFCLRDANPSYTDEGECRRKLQSDMLKIWKNVWTGTKKAAEFQKYEDTPDRFFTLEVAFLREFDKDYPQDFIEDVNKLRVRFVDPNSDGYLFKKQKKELNVPANDLPLLLENIWKTLIQNKELNLPNEKIQLANYRCECLFFEIQKKYEVLLTEGPTAIKNYGQILSQIQSQFTEQSSRYPKQVSDRWQEELLSAFKTKINKIIIALLQTQEQSIEQSFSKKIKEDIFYSDDQNCTFKEESKKYLDEAVQKYLVVLKELNYEVENRKERIEKVKRKLEGFIEEESLEKIGHIEEEFQREGQRQMSMLAGVVVKEHFGLEFWHHACLDYGKAADCTLKELANRYLWARGRPSTSNELDEHEQKLYNWLVNQLKAEFEKNLAQRMLGYFNSNFKCDQHGTNYNFNAMQETKISELYSEAKEMAMKLLETINNFQFSLTKRSSFICAEDFTGDEIKPFLQTSKMLLIKENYEHKANDQFYTAIRRKKEAQAKTTPWYLIALIVYFMYDDLPSPTDNVLLFKLIGFVLVLLAIPFALGQGHVIQQLLNSVFEGVSKKISGLWRKREEK